MHLTKQGNNVINICKINTKNNGTKQTWKIKYPTKKNAQQKTRKRTKKEQQQDYITKSVDSVSLCKFEGLNIKPVKNEFEEKLRLPKVSD